MKNTITTLAVIIILFIALGCEETVDLDYKSNTSKIVIDGSISNTPGPYYVRVTESVALSEQGVFPAIDNAIVMISDDAGNSEILTSDGNGYYKTSSITGVEGRTYTLTVEVHGEKYVASSTMPQQVNFDDIKINEQEILGETEYELIPIYQDPEIKGNYYRFVMSVNNKLVKQHLIQNDEIKNGKINTMRLEVDEEDLDLKPEDTLSITMQCVDENVASFYTSLILMQDSGPGGGTTPANPPNNIDNGALGIFSAHTIQSQTAIIE